MPKNQLKRWLPSPDELKQNKLLRLFAPFLADPRLWHMNRSALMRAIYVGVIIAFLPLPGQMLLALIGALIFRANVPMSIALTWLTNPLTSIPVFWAAYWVGATLLGEPAIGLRTIGIVLTDATLWLVADKPNPFIHYNFFSFKAFGLGLLICAIITSAVCALVFNLFWRYTIHRSWKNRHGYQPHAPKFSAQKGKNKPDAIQPKNSQHSNNP